MKLSRKILVVDDEPAILYLLNEALANIGYSVFLAAKANEAFEILKRESISLIFIDLGLEPMNRFELFLSKSAKTNSAYFSFLRPNF